MKKSPHFSRAKRSQGLGNSKSGRWIRTLAKDDPFNNPVSSTHAKARTKLSITFQPLFKYGLEVKNRPCVMTLVKNSRVKSIVKMRPVHLRLFGEMRERKDSDMRSWYWDRGLEFRGQEQGMVSKCSGISVQGLGRMEWANTLSGALGRAHTSLGGASIRKIHDTMMAVKTMASNHHCFPSITKNWRKTLSGLKKPMTDSFISSSWSTKI